jgi:hypothetical protein
LAPVTDTAIAALDGYMKAGGHLFVLVGPRQGDDKLVTFLSSWGAKLGNDIVLDQEVRLFEGPRVGMQPLAKEYGAHPITQELVVATVSHQTLTIRLATSGHPAAGEHESRIRKAAGDGPGGRDAKVIESARSGRWARRAVITYALLWPACQW